MLFSLKVPPRPWIADRGGEIWNAAHIYLWEKIDKQRFI
nr:MAG TPA: DNA-directed RNA polymerase [Caudoviricetes sp.]